MNTVLQCSYVVMSLLGPNLMQIKKNCKVNTFTAGTTTRIGVHALYAIKQLHEIGYVHRDIKPGYSSSSSSSINKIYRLGFIL